MSDTFQRLAKIISEHLDVPISDVLPGRSLADLGADSLDPIEIVMAAEVEFDIAFPDIDDATLETAISEFVEHIDSAKKTASAA